MHMSISYCTNQKLPRCRKRCKRQHITRTILETGTSNGVSTNIDGIFEIKLRPGSTLTVSYIGYITRTIPTNDKTTFLNIILEEDVFQLDDVVVVGYGSMKKGEVTSAIT